MSLVVGFLVRGSHQPLVSHMGQLILACLLHILVVCVWSYNCAHCVCVCCPLANMTGIAVLVIAQYPFWQSQLLYESIAVITLWWFCKPSVWDIQMCTRSWVSMTKQKQKPKPRFRLNVTLRVVCVLLGYWAPGTVLPVKIRSNLYVHTHHTTSAIDVTKVCR